MAELQWRRRLDLAEGDELSKVIKRSGDGEVSISLTRGSLPAFYRVRLGLRILN